MGNADLLKGGAALTGETMKFYTVVQAILPLIYMGEAVFIKFYNKLVKRKNDPPSQTFMLGYDSLPILADKSLYDIAMWAKKDSNFEKKEFKKKFQAHLDAYGHMIYDLDVGKAVAADSAEPLIDTIKYYMSGKGVNPYKRQEKMVKERELATNRIIKRLGFFRRRWFKKLLKFAQNRAPLREDGLADIGLAYPTARKMFLELGERMAKQGVFDKKDDIFYLKKDEVNRVAKSMDAGKKVSNMQDRIEDRKKLWQWQRSMTPPPLLPKKAKMLGISLDYYFPKHDEAIKDNTIKGLGVSKGIVSGMARVILGPEDFDKMKPGEILVTAITTPAWTPLFALASGIVTDIGGPLTHSSIVAREYGIPAVLNTGIGSKQIKSGQRITVDGDSGIVTLQ
jgi:pyruvate,water dikinase